VCQRELTTVSYKPHCTHFVVTSAMLLWSHVHANTQPGDSSDVVVTQEVLTII